MKALHPIRSTCASTLVVALFAVAILAVLSGQVLTSITSRMQTAQRSAAWNEALTTAESAIDMTVADLTALLPDVRINPDEGVAVGVSQLPTSIITSLGVTTNGLDLSQGITLSFSPTTLTHGGEGAGSQEAKVFIDVLPLSNLLGSGLLKLDIGGLLSNPLGALSGGDLQLVRLRARGTVAIPGQRRADPDSLDAKLRRVSLVYDRTTGAKATRSTVSREIEVLLKPVLPFQSAVTSGSSFASPVADSIYDSYNSSLPTASTSGAYDVTKRLRNGDVIVNGSSVALGGTVLGDVKTNGSTLPPSGQVSGTIDDSFSQPLPYIRTPTWTGSPLVPNSITVSTTLSAGSLLAPARYKFNSISSTLRIRRGLLLGTNVEIWVTGDITGKLIIDPGVTAKVYVQGNAIFATGALSNGNPSAANLQIYGINPTGTGSPVIDIALGNVTAAIYAPTHSVRLTGDGDFQGSITAASFQATGAAHVHYDESLALNVGPILRYAIASWIEREI